MNRLFQATGPGAKRERGAVMIVGLVMVLLMTIVGMAAIRGSNLQEVMAGNMHERAIAFQAAEAGLRTAEQFSDDNTLDSLSFGGSNGLFEDLSSDEDETPVADWSDNDWSSDGQQVSFSIDELSAQPRYVIEKVNVSEYSLRRMQGSGIGVGGTPTPTPTFLRISSRGQDRTGQSDAVVQSIFTKMQ